MINMTGKNLWAEECYLKFIAIHLLKKGVISPLYNFSSRVSLLKSLLATQIQINQRRVFDEIWGLKLGKFIILCYIVSLCLLTSMSMAFMKTCVKFDFLIN